MLLLSFRPAPRRVAAGPLVLILFLLALVLLPGRVCAQADQRLSVIVNPEGTPTELSRPELRKVLNGEQQRWKGGAKVTIALIKTTNPVGEATARQVYKMSGNELNKYWLGLVFQGRAKAPQFFTSESDLVNFVRDTPGAIGLVSQPATGSSKVATVDGKDTF